MFEGFNMRLYSRDVDRKRHSKCMGTSVQSKCMGAASKGAIGFKNGPADSTSPFSRFCLSRRYRTSHLMRKWPLGASSFSLCACGTRNIAYC